jgi:hypothetical protein
MKKIIARIFYFTGLLILAEEFFRNKLMLLGVGFLITFIGVILYLDIIFKRA